MCPLQQQDLRGLIRLACGNEIVEARIRSYRQTKSSRQYVWGLVLLNEHFEPRGCRQAVCERCGGAAGCDEAPYVAAAPADAAGQSCCADHADAFEDSVREVVQAV